MANETAKKLDVNTIVEIKDYEVKQGNLDNELWVEIIEDKLRDSLKVDEDMSIMNTLKKALKENIELKLEREILSRAPKDFEDVKAVVLEEMKHSNKPIKEIVEQVAREHPNLFYNFDDLGIPSELEEIPF